jgi:hypothetical protein
MHRTEGEEIGFVKSIDSNVSLPVAKENLSFCEYLKENSKSYFDPINIESEVKYPNIMTPPCHRDFKDFKNFHYASDTTKNFGGHFSFHEHLHYSDKIAALLGLNTI